MERPARSKRREREAIGAMRVKRSCNLSRLGAVGMMGEGGVLRDRLLSGRSGGCLRGGGHLGMILNGVRKKAA